MLLGEIRGLLNVNGTRGGVGIMMCRKEKVRFCFVRLGGDIGLRLVFLRLWVLVVGDSALHAHCGFGYHMIVFFFGLLFGQRLAFE